MAGSSNIRRELAVRAGGGIEVWLYWDQPSNRITVDVFDEQLGEGFEFEVDAADALDAFRHPYAYAAARRRTRRVGQTEGLAA